MPLCRFPLTLRLRYSRVRGRRQSKFLASSSTGGARNFYPKGGINAPPETVWFLISTASPMGSRAVFQYALDARPRRCFAPAEVIYFNAAAKGAHSARRLSRDSLGEGATAPCTDLTVPARSASPDSTLKYALCSPQGALIRLFPFYTYFKGAGLHQPAPLLCTKMRAFGDLQVDKCAYSCHNLIKTTQRRVRREVQLRRVGVRQPRGRP